MHDYVADVVPGRSSDSAFYDVDGEATSLKYVNFPGWREDGKGREQGAAAQRLAELAEDWDALGTLGTETMQCLHSPNPLNQNGAWASHTQGDTLYYVIHPVKQKARIKRERRVYVLFV